MLYIFPDYQRFGIGRTLVCFIANNFLNNNIGTMFLVMFEDNFDAKQFYESLGGVTIDKHRSVIIVRHDNYIVDLKLVDKKEEGINLQSDEEFQKANWYVIYHGLRGSNRFIRETVEEAFDVIFEKPICSNEK